MMMKHILTLVVVAAVILFVTACGEKKQSNNIITHRVVKKAPSEPIKMPAYTDERSVEWIGKTYVVTIHREPCDSLSAVQDGSGQKFIDNKFVLSVSRADGSVFFTRDFTKQSFLKHLDEDYRKTGILEGFVFDRAEGDNLYFGVSVGHPQTDEYIPLVVVLSRMGHLSVSVDTQMDTNNAENGPAPSDTDEDDGV
jgi:hypothetical protein